MNGPRHRAREAALQILYFWEIGKADPEPAIATYFAEHRPDEEPEARGFAEELVRGTIAGLERLDGLIEKHSRHWRLERLAVVDRLILRLAIWELLSTDTPPAVVVNEALELARLFSTDDAVRFVNGVLDGIIKRPDGTPVTAE